MLFLIYFYLVTKFVNVRQKDEFLIEYFGSAGVFAENKIILLTKTLLTGHSLYHYIIKLLLALCIGLPSFKG